MQNLKIDDSDCISFQNGVNSLPRPPYEGIHMKRSNDFLKIQKILKFNCRFFIVPVGMLFLEHGNIDTRVSAR